MSVRPAPLLTALLALSLSLGIAGRASAQKGPAASRPAPGPIVVVETTKGTFEFETYPSEAPKTVAYILGLVNKRYYNGLRVHRVVPNFVIQWGDPQTRDRTKEAAWGTMGSGSPVGVAEFSKKLTHKKGAVAMAHAGDPAKANGQIYVTLAPKPQLDGKYVVFGQVISGQDVPAKIERGDVIKRIYVK